MSKFQSFANTSNSSLRIYSCPSSMILNASSTTLCSCASSLAMTFYPIFHPYKFEREPLMLSLHCIRILYPHLMATWLTKAELISAIVTYFSEISPNMKRNFSEWNSRKSSVRPNSAVVTEVEEEVAVEVVEGSKETKIRETKVLTHSKQKNKKVK